MSKDFQFQSTHPCGVRPKWEPPRPRPPCFNPRTRAGCDQLPHRFSPPSDCFNPRTRAGCDTDFHLFYLLCLVSIHAPVRGATKRVLESSTGKMFQSTHPCGVRPLTNNYLFSNNLSDIMRECVFGKHIIIRFIYLVVLVT